MGVKVRFYRGAWWVFINHRGRRKAKRIGDRDTARRVGQAIRERLALGDLNLDVSGAGSRLQPYAERWLENATVSLKASTVAFYRGNLTLHVFPALGTRLVSSIRRADCRQVIADCRAKGLALTTVRGIARTLSVVLASAVEDEILPANPALRFAWVSISVVGTNRSLNRTRSRGRRPSTWWPLRPSTSLNGTRG